MKLCNLTGEQATKVVMGMRNSIKTLNDTILTPVNDDNVPPVINEMQILDLSNEQKEGVMFVIACACYFTACDVLDIESQESFDECNVLYNLAKLSLDEDKMREFADKVDELTREQLR